ncbi:MAG TPA: glycosyltransferase [Pyrinomonadaceae bacterium]|nr:glycosyltransferase [Pyrinomonadaceae bacterium]
MKSVHITNYYHKNSGGISTSFNNLLAAAERRKREVRLIVPGEVEAEEQVNDYAKIYYVPAKYSPVFDKRYRIIMPWQYMANDSLVRKIMLAEMPDIVEVTDKYTLSMIGIMIRANKFKQIGRPMLVHFSCERMDDNIGSFLSEGKFGKWFARRVIGNYTMPSFDYHIANSTYTAEEFVNAVSTDKNSRRSNWFFNKCWRWLKAPRVPISERIFVCPRGVDAAQFSPERKSPDVRREMRERAGIPQESTVLLYAGRISPEKNIPLLVDMMEQLANDRDHDYRLLVAGAGPLEQWLKDAGEERAKGCIIQLGHLDKETLSNYYANADVFVHPNPREPFGIAPLEAMASGVATVAPNGGGILSYATAENMWLIEPTGSDFANAVREIVSDDDERDRRIANAVETALANTREASTDRLLDTYETMYADFRERNALFTDRDATKNVNYLELIDV